MSFFQNVSEIFENVRVSRLVRHEVQSPTIARLMQFSSRLFQVLDRGEPLQAEISRRLWVLRSSVIFTLLPFDDPAIALKQQMNDLSKVSTGLPDAVTLLESLSNVVNDIVSSRLNPKAALLLQIIEEEGPGHPGKIAVFSRLSAGRPPGWPDDMETTLASLLGDVTIIRSRKDLRSGVFRRMILPCACRNVAPELLAEVLHSGRTSAIDVLLYPDEKFHSNCSALRWN